MVFNVNIVETSILTILKTILLISLILLAGVIMTAKFDDIITPETPGIFNTSLIYELAALKDIAMPLLEKISKDKKEHAEVVRLIDMLKYFEPIPSEYIPANSLLKEFLGGGYFDY